MGTLPCAVRARTRAPHTTRRERRRGGGGGGGGGGRARAARATEGQSSDRWRGRCSVCATRRLGRGAVGGAAERHASPLEPPTAPAPRRDGRSRGRPVACATDGRSSDRWCGPAVAAPSAPRAPVRCAPARAPMAKSRRLSRRGRDLGDVGERAHDVVGDARPQPRRGDDDGEEHHGGEERPGAAWARSSFRSRRGMGMGFYLVSGL